jgi:cytochrome c oxidase cbb3-type subunit 3
LALMHRMLYPGSGRDAGPAPTPPTLTVRTSSGQTVTGKLARRDEFTITLTDAAGWSRTWPLESVTVSGDEPLRAHSDQLPKYTDEDIHNLIAYLVTLR